ncbi:hypothetical protein BAE44_0020177 [Dichanthelium oligosanthes]|uniref:Uncharacterized protein n=1 Tax=Dichanthelium oligosanthes TaxID=888268 RepID=A0A1E5V180_9POAL|nr:hypothetical protein BAE44_0020177 [Dichanthelium oligosanthes]
MISPLSVHLNSDILEDPLSFNPWRWQMHRKPNMLRTLVLIYCIYLFMYFIHVLFGVHRWKEMKRGEMFRVADFAFPQDYHIKLFPRSIIIVVLSGCLPCLHG